MKSIQVFYNLFHKGFSVSKVFGFIKLEPTRGFALHFGKKSIIISWISKK